MREIKFRGKRVDNNEWVYGSYLFLQYGDAMKRVGSHCIVLTDGHTHKVHPESVGQFIDKKDKRNVDVYEKDIVVLHERDGFIVSEGRKQGYKDRNCSVVWEDGRYVLNIYGLTNLLWGNWFELFNNDEWIEVIGNTTDNPELLKGGRKCLKR